MLLTSFLLTRFSVDRDVEAPVIVPFPLVEISYYCRKILGVILFTDVLTFCIEIVYDSFE